MKAIREVGFLKAIKYVFYTLWFSMFKILLFSPLRIIWMKLFGASIGSGVIIENIKFENLYRTGLRGLTIGNNCYIGDGVVFDLADKIILKNHVTLAAEVYILTHVNVGYKNHPLQKSIPAMSAPCVFENGCFVGIRSTIMPGVTIGQMSAVGACSLVTKDVPAGELHFGTPSEFKKRLV